MQGSAGSGSISIRRISRIRWPPTASRSRIATRACGSSGSSTAYACRRIGAEVGRQLGQPCVTNVWIPDGFKDLPVDRKAPRERLAASLDAIFAEPIDPAAQSRCGRIQALRHRQRELRRRLARVLPRLRHHAAKALLPRRRAFSSDRTHRGQDLVASCNSCPDCCCTSAAACAGTAITSSLLDDPTRAILEEVVRGEYPRPHAHRPGFLRRQHQPHRRVGDRHAQCSEGAAARAAGAGGNAARAGGRRRSSPRAWRCWRN